MLKLTQNISCRNKNIVGRTIPSYVATILNLGDQLKLVVGVGPTHVIIPRTGFGGFLNLVYLFVWVNLGVSLFRSFKYRLYANANQLRELSIMLETHRRLYNECLEIRKSAYENTSHLVKNAEQCSWFTTERTKNPFYKRINSSSARATIQRLDDAYSGFFRRLKTGNTPGYPKHKSRNQFNTVIFPSYGNGIKLIDGRLRVQHVGSIRVKLHRQYIGEIKEVSLTRECDKWFVVISCKTETPERNKTDLPRVGIDLGLQYFLTTTDGDRVANPRFLKKSLAKLREASRSCTRKGKFSANRRRARKALAKVYYTIANSRRDFHHKTAIDLVRRYDSIAVESLNILGMLKNHGTARSISDAGWSNFLLILRSKAEVFGREIVVVDSRGTSQECSSCGELVPKSLSIRTHDCPYCGLVIDRDLNAARNILARAGAARAEPVGVNFACGVSQEAEQLIAA